MGTLTSLLRPIKLHHILSVLLYPTLGQFSRRDRFTAVNGSDITVLFSWPTAFTSAVVARSQITTENISAEEKHKKAVESYVHDTDNIAYLARRAAGVG